MQNYRPRIVDTAVETALSSIGGVLIEGARAVGKTTTGLFHAASSIRLDAEPRLAEIASVDPNQLLDGPAPRLIDEWQLAPPLWNAVRHEIDRRGAPGQFILTGSATPADDLIRHSGAGRFIRIRMRTLSLYESGESEGRVSMSSMFSTSDAVAALSSLSVMDYARLLVRGGWPLLVRNPDAEPTAVLGSYLEDVARVDLRSNGVSRDPVKVAALLRALARNVSTETSKARLAREAEGAEPMTPATVANYLDDLTRIFVLEEQPAWAAHLRSRVRQRTSPKWQFLDPSLAAVLLGADAQRLLGDLNTFGLLFEALAIRDLRIYAEASDARVYHYRDETGLEVDAIVEDIAGRWIACEIKLGGEAAVERAAQQLIGLRDKLAEPQRERLAALVVVTAGQVAYTRDDGVHVVPLGQLGP